MAAKNGCVSVKWLASLLEVLKLSVSEHELQLLFGGVLVWVDGSRYATPHIVPARLSIVVVVRN